MGSVLKNDIGLADALAITLNQEASFPPEKIYAAAAVDWMYRQLAPRERINLALVSCRRILILKVVGGITIDVATVEALVAKYIRGSHMELYTSRCCDMVALPDRRWNSGLEETRNPIVERLIHNNR
ncbi:hypothetical protein HDU82_008230 [Entophlyctis luteolus]|nr:hypothetical protein HDU82_008230 [Entophlyctis luteolus]